MTKKQFIFIGTYTRTMPHVNGKAAGIYVYTWDPDGGKTALIHTQTGIANPSFIALHPRRPFVYAVSEIDDYKGAPSGAVTAYAFNPETGGLSPLNVRESHGTGPCHLSLSEDGRMLVIVNYLSGSVASFLLNEDGFLGEATSVFQHRGASVNPDRQEGPHPHSAIFDPAGGRVIVPDLGLDKLVIYPLSPEGLSLLPSRVSIDMPPGAGPRHLTFHPVLKRAYCSNELDSTVTVLAENGGEAGFTPVQHISTLPKGAGLSTAADIHVHPAGKFLYASNRGHDSIGIFDINQTDGTLTFLGCEPIRGRTPRNFLVTPDGSFLLAGGQDSDTLTIFSIDKEQGSLTHIRTEPVPNPVCMITGGF